MGRHPLVQESSAAPAGAVARCDDVFEQEYGYAPGRTYGGDCHTYGLLWNAHEIVWYVDSSESGGADAVTVARDPDVCGPMYLCINRPTGESCPDLPDNTTPFPAQMDIGYVRVRAA